MSVGPSRKLLDWLSGEIKTPPFSQSARVEAGMLLRRLQEGESVGMPHSRPMPRSALDATSCGSATRTGPGGMVYRIDPRRIVIASVFPKTTRETPRQEIENCRQRLKSYDEIQDRGRGRGDEEGEA